MDIITLIEEIEDLVEEAKSVPFSKNVMIDADQLYDIIHDMRQNLPEEIKQAAWVQEEKDRILAEATREAESIVSDANRQAGDIESQAKEQFLQLVDEHQVVVEARSKAGEIQEKAEASARTMRMESISYVDEILAKTQHELNRVVDTLEDNRRELRED